MEDNLSKRCDRVKNKILCFFTHSDAKTGAWGRAQRSGAKTAIFLQANSFADRNRQKTQQDFAKLADCKLEVGENQGVVSVNDISFL